MFEGMKEFLRARESLDSVSAQLAEAEAQLQEVESSLANAQTELAARENTIAKRDEIIAAIHRQTTREREAVLADYAGQEAKIAKKLANTEKQLRKAKTYFEDCERQVYCMANLYKALRAAVTQFSVSALPEDLNITEEELEELRLTEESVGLKMHSYKMTDLRKMHKANNTLLEQLLVRYENKLIIPADRLVFQLMTLGIRAELQQIINEMEYGELERAQVKLHLIVGKYLKIVSFANVDGAQQLVEYASELEVLLKETLRLEHEYCLRRTDYERRRRVFGDIEEDESDEQEGLEDTVEDTPKSQPEQQDDETEE